MSIQKDWWTNIPEILSDPMDTLLSYIIDPQIPIHDPKLYIQSRQPNISQLYYAPSCLASTTLVANRDFHTGEIINYVEENLDAAESTPMNSMSLKRVPGPIESSTKGSATNYPFWPGGFDEPLADVTALIYEDNDANNIDSYFNEDLLTIPPGFDRGCNFNDGSNANLLLLNDVGCGDVGNIEKSNLIKEFLSNNDPESINLLSFVENEQNIFDLWQQSPDKQKNDDDKYTGDGKSSLKNKLEQSTSFVGVDDDEILESINTTGTTMERPILQISDAETIVKNMKWAEMVDVTQPVMDFELRIPNPARVFNFELDIFQKQAILKLEEHNHVFVAAHTSAGKTVVAEYAIALSKQHMTRTIYTSPIKALSNQKYHDFKGIFKDVGLITGDIQIDSTASCLIMTTEILRSMLYCGSEVTRDLEYVIFDEVHYITDPDRGYVWEEVLILLPDHVSIVMLSATVPNTLEFANWVGQTKKRKVYVCSTLKRPIPLMHYLYTGNGGKSKNDIFLLVNGQNEFQQKGLRDAIASKEKDKPTNKFQKQPRGGGGGFNPKQEQLLWNGIIDYLKRNNKLPVVSFTLSRNRCDRNLKALESTDLCTSKEAGYNYMFFQKCIQQLKPEDRALPQVLTLQDSLKRGIGVHHSGILPILKEIVEILFQEGHVKLLFATETFAMGVNMPARTVIFDSIRKFDGVEMRALRPAEYTQMAGRAGRRGKDDTGTVILLCKGDVPSEMDLRTMILGKPMRLESQFRLTYSMILNLLRVESVSVEDMMSHSFMEFGSRTKLPENKELLKQIELQIEQMQTINENMKPLCEFYELTNEYIQLKNAFMNEFVAFNQKDMKPGRILIVTYENHYNKLGVLLAITGGKETTYRLLVLNDQNQEEKLYFDDPSGVTSSINQVQRNRNPLWHQMLSLTVKHKNYLPIGIGGHTILSIKSENIVEITKNQLKIEADKIIQNWEQRQIPRFRDSPPGPTIVKTVNELLNLSTDVAKSKIKLELLNFKKEFQLTINLDALQRLRKRITDIGGYTNAANFENEFSIIFDRKQLEKIRDDLKFKSSKESFALYPDYLNKLNVLKSLSYIDDQHQVTMKGRVACEMGSNELIITELVLCNTFTELDADEIPALLSSLVFQAKTEAEPILTENLKKCKLAIENVDKMIGEVEASFDVARSDNSVTKDRLNFGLVEVVYEWARNKTFAEIIKLTDIQEGIIVRCIQQLNETLQDVKDAARIIGNPALHKKMEDASNAIQRNIVFTASLYFQN